MQAYISCVSDVRRRSFVDVAFVPVDTTLHPPIPSQHSFFLSFYLKTWSEFWSLDFTFRGESRGQNDSLRRAPKVQKWCATTLWYRGWWSIAHCCGSGIMQMSASWVVPVSTSSNSFEISILFPTCSWTLAMISAHCHWCVCSALAAAATPSVF